MTQVDVSPLTDIQRDCLQQYDLPQAEFERELAGGMFARPVLLGTDRGAFVLRTHRFRGTESAFCFQAETIQWAYEHGVPAATVEPTLSGTWCVPLPAGQGVMAVHRYVDGASDDWQAWHHRKETQDNFLNDLGRRVAYLHNQLATATPNGDARLSIALPPIQFNQLGQVYTAWQTAIRELQHRPEIACNTARLQLLELQPRIDAHWAHLLDTVAKGAIDTLPRQIVHGDISAVNIVWNNRHQPVFIDWDTVHYGYRMYDALGDILNRVPDDRPDWNQYRLDHIDEYLTGYASALDDPLTDQERELVPTFCLSRQLEDLRQRVAVLPNLHQEHEQRYAKLIRMRVEMMDQIEASVAASH